MHVNVYIDRRLSIYGFNGIGEIKSGKVISE